MMAGLQVVNTALTCL